MTAKTQATQASRPAATACRLVLDIAPGQHLLTCLPAGSTLQSLEGDIQLGFGPLICGQVLHAAQQTLAAGQALTQERGAPATWVRLHNPGREMARALLMESAPQRSGLAHAWAWVAARWTKAASSNAANGANAAHRVGAA